MEASSQPNERFPRVSREPPYAPYNPTAPPMSPHSIPSAVPVSVKTYDRHPLPPRMPPVAAFPSYPSYDSNSIGVASTSNISVPMTYHPPQPASGYDMHRPSPHLVSHRHRHHQRHIQSSSKYRSLSFFVKLVLFNVGNGMLGIAALMVVFAGVFLSLVALPLCGFGLILFQVLIRVVYFACRMDVLLHNLLASSNEKIVFCDANTHDEERGPLLPLYQPISINQQLRFDAEERPVFENSLEFFSPRAVLATLYFGSVKFFASMLSIIALSLLMFGVDSFLGDPDAQLHFSSKKFDDPFAAILLEICVLLVAVVLLHVTARLSQSMTRFFCCESGS